MHRMIEMHSKYDNMHINVMFYALNCINNHVLSCYDCMLSPTSWDHGPLIARDVASSKLSKRCKLNGRPGFKSGNFFYK